MDLVAVADEVLQQHGLHLANLLTAPHGEVVGDAQQHLLDIGGQGVEPLFGVDDDAGLVRLARQEQVALPVVEALVPGRCHREQGRVVEPVHDTGLKTGHRVRDVDRDRARSECFVGLDMGDRLLRPIANSLHVDGAPDGPPAEVRTEAVLAPECEDELLLLEDRANLFQHLRVVEGLVGMFHAIEDIGRLENVHLADDGAQAPHGAGEALLAPHLGPPRQRPLV